VHNNNFSCLFFSFFLFFPLELLLCFFFFLFSFFHIIFSPYFSCNVILFFFCKTTAMIGHSLPTIELSTSVIAYQKFFILLHILFSFLHHTHAVFVPLLVLFLFVPNNLPQLRHSAHISFSHSVIVYQIIFLFVIAIINIFVLRCSSFFCFLVVFATAIGVPYIII